MKQHQNLLLKADDITPTGMTYHVVLFRDDGEWPLFC